MIESLFAGLPPPLPIGFPGVPAGAVVAFAGALGSPLPNSASPPDSATGDTSYVTDPIEAWGWMLCDGRALDSAEYPELFQVLGYRYGGSGASFNIPDYRGYFLRGTDSGRELDPDRSQRQNAAGETSEQVGSTQQDALQCHRHSYTEPKGQTTAEPGSGSAVASAVPEQCTGYPDEAVCNTAVKTSKDETRPVNIYVNYLIKFTYGPYGPLFTP